MYSICKDETDIHNQVYRLKSFCKGCITLYGIENGILASGKYDVVMTVPRAQYEKRGLLATMGQV